MNKTKIYFWIFVIALIAIIAGFILNIPIIKGTSRTIFTHISNIWILVPAVISAFLFNKSRYYWLIMIALGIIDAVCVHIFIANRTLSGLAVHPLIMRTVSFLTVVYLINLTRLILRKL